MSEQQISIPNGTTMVIVARHPKHKSNEISPDEAERVRKQGQRLVKLGLKPEQVSAAVASQRGRSQRTAELLQAGIGCAVPLSISPILDALDEMGDLAKPFKKAALDGDMKPWEALSEQRGQELCSKSGIPDRLVRATRALAVWTMAAQLNQNQAVIVSDHNGHEIEPGLELAKVLSGGGKVHTPDALPDPVRYVEEAGMVLLLVNWQNGLLTKDPVYLDAES